MKVIDNVYALNSTKASYVYLIVDDEISLVDTGFPGQGDVILRQLKSLNIKPTDIKHILLTHHDVDHIGNISALQKATGAKVWISKEDLPYMYGNLKRHGIKKPLSALYAIEMPENVFEYNEGQKIGNIQVIPTPGHTPGHVSFICKDALFTGDLVVNYKTKIVVAPKILTWSRKALKESIKKVEHLDFNWICPTHGKPVERGDIWEKLIK